MPANAILPQRIYRLAHRVRQQAGSYRFVYAERCRCRPDQWILRTQKVAGVARINGFCVRRRLSVLPGPTDFAYAEGCRCCPDQWILRTPKAVGIAGSTVGARLPAKTILMQRIYRLAHRVRQQAGSRFAFAEGCGCCPDQRILRTPKVAGVARINGFRVRGRLRMLPGSTDFAYAEGCRDCADQL